MMKTPIGTDGKDALKQISDVLRRAHSKPLEADLRPAEPQADRLYVPVDQTRSQTQPRSRGAAVWIAIAVVGGIVLGSQFHREEHTSSVTSVPTPSATPSAAPVAPLVRPVPRATLVRLPDPWLVGHTRVIWMPSGLDAVATLKGVLASTSQLPTAGNRLGDTWAVGDHCYVWLTAPGAAAPSWIDP
jgi:hypothetical protein